MHRAMNWMGAAVMLAACAGTPASPEARRLAEARLLQPFLRPVEVGCSELLIELTGNFHGNVAQPAIDVTVHEARKEYGSGYVDTIWTNRLGDPSSAFVITIGEASQMTENGIVRGNQTKFTVLDQVRMRVLQGTRELTLAARASGQIVMVKEANAKPTEVREFAIVDGMLQNR